MPRERKESWQRTRPGSQPVTTRVPHAHGIPQGARRQSPDRPHEFNQSNHHLAARRVRLEVHLCANQSVIRVTAMGSQPVQEIDDQADGSLLRHRNAQPTKAT